MKCWHRRRQAVALGLAWLSLAASAAAQAGRPAAAAEAIAPPPPASPAPAAPASAAPAGAQTPPAPDRLSLYAYTLRNRRLDQGLELVRGLLSPVGSVEAQPATNTLLIRDSLSALARVVPALRRFDQPPKPVTLEVQLLRAGPQSVSPPVPEVAGPLVQRLRKLLRYENYIELARARLAAEEGAAVAYELSGGYRVEFQVGAVSEDQRIRLHGFRVARLAGGEQELVHTTINNLRQDQPYALVLTRSEESGHALVVAVTFLRPETGN